MSRPLLQRSTKVRYVADDAEVQLDVTLLPEIPHNGTGQCKLHHQLRFPHIHLSCNVSWLNTSD